MPTYHCKKCSKEVDVPFVMTGALPNCRDCASKTEVELPMVNIPANMRATNSADYYGKQAHVPINIIDKNDKGEVTKVTTISKDGREPEPL